jgi:hypothetical protein
MAEAEDPHLALAKEATSTAASYKAASDKMRDRADNWGKSLTTLGTAVVGYIGISKATLVFPVPSGWWWLPVLTYLLLAVMAGLAIFVGWRLSRVARPIVMQPNPKEIEISQQERVAVASLYRDQALLNGFDSLEKYDERAREIFAEWEKHADGTHAPDQPFSRGVQLRAEVQSAMQRGSTLIVRRRFTEATTGWITLGSIVVFLMAALVVGLTTDALDAVRTSESRRVTDTLTKIKACTDAQAGKAANPTITVALPADCFAPSAPASP